MQHKKAKPKKDLMQTIHFLITKSITLQFTFYYPSSHPVLLKKKGRIRAHSRKFLLDFSILIETKTKWNKHIACLACIALHYIQEKNANECKKKKKMSAMSSCSSSSSAPSSSAAASRKKRRGNGKKRSFQ